MAKLISEYTDVRNIRHKVEHTVLSDNNKDSRERILEEIMLALTKKYRKKSKPS